MTAPVSSTLAALRPLLALLLLGLTTLSLAQRPGGGMPPGRGPGAMGPGANPGTNPTPVTRILTATGVLTGEVVTATVILQPAPPAGTTPSYQWTITGGRILGEATRATIQWTAEAAGTVTLNVTATSGTTVQTATLDATAVSAAAAGSITAVTTAAMNATDLTASVPPAQNSDRTFRWTATGAGAAITAGQGTNAITYRVANAGLLELTCDVTLQRLVTVTLRSFVVVNGDGPPTALTINSGTGSGTYNAGSRVDIFAHPPPAGQVFDRWTGDTAALGTGALAALLPHVVITMPATPTTLTATYKAAPAWSPTVVQNFNPVTQTGANNTTTTVSTTLNYHIPSGAQGVVFLLHDTGGAANFWFEHAEALLLARDLVAAGYGVAALNSVNRATGAWSAQATLANNLDAANIAAALDRFTRDNLLAATRPVFLLGLAGGADAAARFAELLATTAPARPIRGAVLYCATGGGTLAVTSGVPQFFALAPNDQDLGDAGNINALENSRLLAGRGIAAAVSNNTVSPVHPGRFRALGVNTPTFTAADAATIWTAVKAGGFLDANNYVKELPSAAALRAALPATFQPRTAEVAAQLAVAYGAREFYSDANARVIAFLNARVAGTAAPAPGRMVNLSTRAKIAFAGDAFTLGFNITGPERATLLIRGIGPALARFGLSGVLPAPRLEVNRGSTIIATNENWERAANRADLISAAASVGAFALTPGDADAAVLLTLDPGSYTAAIKGLNGAVGEVLAEVYDVSKNSTRLTNLSTLAAVNEEGGLITPGIVIQGANPRTLVARAVAPGLADFGLPASALLGDPRITILNGTGGAVATNNNWAQPGAAGGQAGMLNAVFPAVGAFALRATNADAAIVTALNPGSFTLQAGAAPLPTGANVPANFVAPNQTGSLLVEVYEVP